ncbi:hypothetical protein ASF27_20965 [Methylobacterium sp. Leaf102]|nr:hypothetical protein ASF27_20965 [Methylobacterium sp. Leaf102]
MVRAMEGASRDKDEPAPFGCDMIAGAARLLPSSGVAPLGKAPVVALMTPTVGGRFDLADLT